MDIDSGGGGITASDILYKALLDFRAAQEGRVVVAVFNDVAASGAYYIALAADHIIAHPTTITGSIGVLMQSMNVKDLAQKIGIRDVTIKSGDNKDLLNPFNEMSPEQRDMLQGLVDEFHSRFVRLVAEGRDLPEAQVRELADGRIYSANDAEELGLVDQIGYWSDAVAKTTELLDVEQVRVLRYEKEISFSSLFRGMEQENPMSKILQSLSRTRLMYLWEM
jgi:protease-4